MNTISKQLQRIFLPLVLVALSIGCSGSQNPLSLGSSQQADIVAYDIRGLPDTINVDDNVRAHAIAIFDDGTEVDFTLGVSWTTSDSSVAALDNTIPGTVIGVSAGRATIMVDDGTVTGMKDITVIDPGQ
jgi:hypothetical protein